jgi:hypothetical protein
MTILNDVVCNLKSNSSIEFNSNSIEFEQELNLNPIEEE